MKRDKSIQLGQAEKRSEVLKKLTNQVQMRTGWIEYMRAVLGLTLQDLAKRAGISKPTTAQSERREAEGKVTLETLKKMANAMECDLFYAFVPRKKIGSILMDQAIQKARSILSRADTHMSLEDQKVEESMDIRIQRLAQKLIDNGNVW